MTRLGRMSTYEGTSWHSAVQYVSYILHGELTKSFGSIERYESEAKQFSIINLVNTQIYYLPSNSDFHISFFIIFLKIIRVNSPVVGEFHVVQHKDIILIHKSASVSA